MQGLIYGGSVLMMSGWGEVREARFSKNDGYPQRGGAPNVFLPISNHASAVNETVFHLAFRRMNIIRNRRHAPVSFPRIVIMLLFLRAFQFWRWHPGY